MPLPLEAFAISELYLIWDIKVRQRIAPILFFFLKYAYQLLLKTCPQQFCNIHFRGAPQKPWLLRSAILKPILQYFLQKNRLSSTFFKVSESHKLTVTKSQGDKASRIAGEDLVARNPPERKHNRVGAHAPVAIAREPERVHGPDIAVVADGVHDVGVAVDQQHAILALALLFHKLEQISERGRSAGAEFGENGGIHRRFFQTMDGEVSGFDILLDFPSEEPVKIGTRPANVGLLLGAVVGDESLHRAYRDHGNSPKQVR